MSADVYSDEGYHAVVPEWVLDADISAQAVRLYAVLRRYADQRTMHAHPSRKTLADRLHVKDEKVVDRALTDLQRIHAVDVFPRWRNEAGEVVYAPDADHRERTSNGYRITRGVPSLEGRGGGGKAPTPRLEGPHRGGAEAPTVGAQKGEEPQPGEPQPVEPQHSLPSVESGAPAAEQLPIDAETSSAPSGRTAKRKVRMEVPKDWKPSTELAAWTSQTAPGMPRSEVAAFIDKHRSLGNKFLDLDAAWRTWVRNWIKYGNRGGRPGSTRPGPYRDEVWTDGSAQEDWASFMATGGTDR